VVEEYFRLNMTIRRIFLLPLLLAAVAAGCSRLPASQTTRQVSDGDEVLARAIEDRARSLKVEGEGVVIKILSDDREGSRHQRFIVRLRSGQTLLIAHNVDQAPRISSLREGDTVAFNGEYEWNPQGGVIHWTHKDQSGRHSAGWLKHNGVAYQ
jgi:hypothetical protein